MYAVIIGLTLGTHSLSAVTVTWDGSAGTGAGPQEPIGIPDPDPPTETI